MKKVKIATRLDFVVGLRERAEDRALQDLSEAQRAKQQAEQSLEEATQSVRRDDRRPGRAEEWLLVEAAHARALKDAQKAQAKVNDASAQVQRSRHSYGSAHAQAESVRRAAEARRADRSREETRKEQRGLDEIATLRFAFATRLR